MMKLWAWVFVSAFFFVNSSLAEDPGNVVHAYYFHGNVRCPTCHKIEQYSQEAIEKNFKRELEAGTLVFESLNVEEKGNEHYVQDYQLYTKALVISRMKDGRELKSKNLTRIWEWVGDKEKFQNYVREEVADFLKEH